jgi:hypothetical protein
MLEMRRILYDSLPERAIIVPGRLLGTRSAWMADYKPLLSDVEFTRFFYLMRGLAPYVLLILDPTFTSHRRDRCPTIARSNLELVLRGHPSAPLLFKP